MKLKVIVYTEACSSAVDKFLMTMKLMIVSDKIVSV
jgi:hypothetical protein